MALEAVSSPSREFRRAIERLDEPGCYLRGDRLIGCDTAHGARELQAAHYPIPKQTLGLASVAAAAGAAAEILIAHPGNGFLVCGAHHEAIDKGGLLVCRDDLPIRYQVFEDQFDLEWLTLKVYARREAYSTRLWRPQSLFRA